LQSTATLGRNIAMPADGDEESLDECPLHLNHYAIQSREFFGNVKMTRGDVSSVSLASHRDWDYFDTYDHREVVDEELKDMCR